MADKVKRRVVDSESESEPEEDDPWEVLGKEEDVKREKQSALERRKRRIAEGKEVPEEPEDAQLVVPVRDLVNFAGKGRVLKERRQSAFGFAHFSTEEETQKQIVQFKNNYGIDALLSLLDFEDVICQRYAALALGNIVSNETLAGPLIEFGVLEAMLPLAVADETDLETKRYCILAVANMAADPSTHPVILQSLISIILLLDSEDEEIQKCGSLTIQNMAANKDIIAKLDDCIQPLVNLISIMKGKVPLPDAKLHALAALRGLATQDLMRLRIINEGALRGFIMLIDDPPSDHILVEIAAVLCSFSSLYETHIDLLQSAVLHSIFLLAMGDIVESQRYAATALANLASNTANHNKLIQANAIPNLITMCDFQDPRVRGSAARALANISADPQRHRELVNVSEVS